MSGFDDRLHEGNVITDIVRGLLQKSGYLVFLNGWEERFFEIKEQLSDKTTRNSRTVRMIKSSPDLLVYDRRKKDAMFVEVKMRRAKKESSVLLKPSQIAHYKEFWKDAILVLVMPCGDMFYAQKFSELEIREEGEYNAETDFDRFENVFTEVNVADLLGYKAKAKRAMEK